LDASERSHDRPGGHLSTSHEHCDIARRALEDDREIPVRVATVQEPRGSVEKYEIHVVLSGESHRIHAWVARGVDSDAGCDAFLRECVSVLGERGARGPELTIVAQEPSHDELARGTSGQ